MTKTKLGIALLFAVALIVTSGTFAYWRASLAGDSESLVASTVTIGAGNAVTTTVTVTDIVLASALVPVGHTGTNDVDFNFQVEWDADQAGASGVAGTLAVTYDSFAMTGLTEPELAAMFTITLPANASITEGAAAQTATVNVEFSNEPATQALYNLVASGNLSVNVTFTVTPD